MGWASPAQGAESAVLDRCVQIQGGVELHPNTHPIQGDMTVRGQATIFTRHSRKETQLHCLPACDPRVDLPATYGHAVQ